MANTVVERFYFSSAYALYIQTQLFISLLEGSISMVGRRLLKYRLLMFLLCLLICLSLLSACGGNTFPLDQANACTTQVHARVQNFTKLPASSQTLYVSSGTNLYALDARNGATRWCDQIKSSGLPSYDNIKALTLDQTNALCIYRIWE
jgi:hypothetical protein